MKSLSWSFLFLFSTAVLSHLAAQTTNQPASDVVLVRFGVRPIGNWQVDPVETQELNQIFNDATAAANSIPPSVDAGVQRHAVDNSLRNALENFLAEHPNSAYGPGVHIWPLRHAALRLFPCD
jgi:hypothetical protein